MTTKRFRKGKSILTDFPTGAIIDKKTGERYYDGIKPSYISSEELVKTLNELHEENIELHIQNDFLKDENQHMRDLVNENKQLKAQLYCDDEEGVCNVCKHHYLIKDDESELGYYNSRCKKGHNYECARVSLKHCKDFEKELKE